MSVEDDVNEWMSEYRKLLDIKKENDMTYVMNRKEIWDHIKDYVTITRMEIDPQSFRLVIDGKELEVFVSDTSTLIIKLSDLRAPDNENTFDLRHDYADDEDVPF